MLLFSFQYDDDQLLLREEIKDGWEKNFKKRKTCKEILTKNTHVFTVDCSLMFKKIYENLRDQVFMWQSCFYTIETRKNHVIIR